MKITIDELIKDFYRLADEEGYFSCLCEHMNIIEEDEREYYENILEITEKYIPNYKDFMGSQFFEEDTSYEQKGQMLSSLCMENFREIFHGLIIKNGEKV